MSTPEEDAFLATRGNYRKLRVFQVATIIYDITFHFAHTYLRGNDRTVDQMIQAARSGKQNIAEGSCASNYSTSTEMTLTGVAQSSLQELLIDYEDYLRVRGLEQWTVDHPKTQQTRLFCRNHADSADYMPLIRQRSDETTANIAIVLIHQCDYLLTRLTNRQKRLFLEQGGVKEGRTKARLAHRNGQR